MSSMRLRPGNFWSFLETRNFFWNSLGVHCAFWTPTGFWKTVGPVGETMRLRALCFWSQWIQQCFSCSLRHPWLPVLSRASPTSTKSSGCLCWQAVPCRFVTIMCNSEPTRVQFLQAIFMMHIRIHKSFASKDYFVSCTKLERFDQWGFHLRYLTQQIIWCAMMPLS